MTRYLVMGCWLYGLLSVFPSSADAQIFDSCDSVLSHGIYDSYSNVGSSFSSAEFHNAMCNGTVSQHSENDRAGGGGMVSVGIPGVVDIGLGGDYQQARSFQEYYKQVFCRSGSGRRIDDSQLSNFRTVISPTIVEAYKTCVQARARGLEVNVQRVDNNVVTFGLTFSQPASTAEFSAMYISPKSAASCVSPTLMPKTKLDGATRAITCTRASNGLSEFAITIHTTVDIFSYLMPALPVPTKSAAVPIGAIEAFVGADEPPGWKLCNGQFLSVRDYPELFRIIGFTMGGNKENTRFALPDLRGRFIRGLNGEAMGSARDPDANRSIGSVQDWGTALPKSGWTVSTDGAHRHNAISRESQGRDTVHEGTDRTPGELDIRWPHDMDLAGNHSHAITGGDKETRPVNVGVNYLIYTGIPSGPR